MAAVFPGIPLNVIRGAVHAHGSIERAVNALLSCCASMNASNTYSQENHTEKYQCLVMSLWSMDSLKFWGK